MGTSFVSTKSFLRRLGNFNSECIEFYVTFVCKNHYYDGLPAHSPQR